VQGGFNGFHFQKETKQRCKNKTAKDCVNLAAASWEKYYFFFKGLIYEHESARKLFHKQYKLGQT